MIGAGAGPSHVLSGTLAEVCKEKNDMKINFNNEDVECDLIKT